jgi:regulator of sigma E protease
MDTITFILVLSFLVFFHELGHFLVARFYGVKVYTFSIGFGKKLWSKHYKGTEWVIAPIPLGGYVKMKGQDDMDPSKAESGEDSYTAKTPFQKIQILLAGPFANFVLAGILFFFIAILGNKVYTPSIGQVLENSPALEAGLLKDDKIVQINNTKITTWDEMTSIIKSSDGTLKLYIKRANQTAIKIIYVTPKLRESVNLFGEKIYKKMVGIAPSGDTIIQKHNIFSAVDFAIEKTIGTSTIIFKSVQKLIDGSVPSSEIGGVIAIGTVVSDAREAGLVALLTISAFISVNLGVLNLLPIPALDGGHIMFNTYEMITRRKPSPQVLTYMTMAGWVLLLGLMFLGVYNDINRYMK